MLENDTEIRNRLKEALQLIHSKEYREARRLLQDCDDHPVGRKLLTQIDNIATYSTRVYNNLQAH